MLYETRRVWFEELAHKHLDGLATWVSPRFIPLHLFDVVRSAADSYVTIFTGISEGWHVPLVRRPLTLFLSSFGR